MIRTGRRQDLSIFRLTGSLCALNMSATIDFSLDRFFEGRTKRSALRLRHKYSLLHILRWIGRCSRFISSNCLNRCFDSMAMRFDMPWTMNVITGLIIPNWQEVHITISFDKRPSCTDKKMDITYRTAMISHKGNFNYSDISRT